MKIAARSLLLAAVLACFAFPVVGQSAAGSLEDPFGDLDRVSGFFDVPFAGPVGVFDGEIEVLVPNLLLPQPIAAWNVLTFQGDVAFDILPDQGTAFGTGMVLRDPPQQELDGDVDLLSASIFEDGAFSRLRAQLRELPLPSETGLQWNLNIDPSGETAERFLHLVPFQPSALGWVTFVTEGTLPFPWQPTAYYDLLAAAIDASNPGEIGAAVALAADLPHPPPEALAAPPVTPMYSFFINSDGDPATGGLGGFELSFSVFFNPLGELDTVVRRFNGAFFEVDRGVPSLAAAEDNLVFVGLDGSDVTLVEEFLWAVKVDLVVWPPGTTEFDDGWVAEIDKSEIVAARPLIEPSPTDEGELAEGEEDLENAKVAVNRDGRTVVVWQGPDGDGLGVFAIMFGADGVPEGPPFFVPSDTAGDQSLPDVAWIEDRVMFVWKQSRPPNGGNLRVGSADEVEDPQDIVGRIFDDPGQPAGDDIVISDEQDDIPEDPELTADGDGDVVVTWEDDGEVRGRQYEPTGDPKGPSVGLGGGLLEEEDPVVAASPTGDVFAVWEERPLTALVSGGEATSRVLLRVFGPDGEPKGEPRVVADGGAENPDLAVSDSGEVVVVYQAPGEEDDDVFVRLYGPDGRPRSAGRRVNQMPEGNQRAPRVDSNSAGDTLVVWEDDGGPGGESTIDGRVLEPGGTPASPDVTLAETVGDSRPVEPDVVIDNDDEATIVFTRRRPGQGSDGLFRANLDATFVPGRCGTTGHAQCLQQSRFRVQVLWSDNRGSGGGGQAVPLTSDTGYFWFFNQENVEMVIKLLDACDFNGHFWVFAGGLTDVEVAIVVDDTASGVTRTYYNPPHTPFQPIQDTSAFATCDVKSPNGAAASGAEVAAGVAWRDLSRTLVDEGASIEVPSPTGGACSSDPTVLCLNGARFAVEVDWETPSGEGGQGQPVALTSDTGYLWFFDEDNVEVVIKVLDACDLNGNFWVFAGGLTSVHTTVKVTDLESGAAVTYENPQNTAFQPIQDTAAFATCP